MWCCGCGGQFRRASEAKDDLYSPLLEEREREAVSELLTYLEHRDETDFFSGAPLKCLSTLIYSENHYLQRSAALACAEITEKNVREVSDAVLEPILYLLKFDNAVILRAASAAIGNLAIVNENKRSIVRLGGLDSLIQLMMAPSLEVQCNAVGCITNLATHEDNKSIIARSGALIPLLRLAQSLDLRVQRNASGALLNMTHTETNRAELVKSGAIPVLARLFVTTTDLDVQHYCTTALSNLAVDAESRSKLSDPNLSIVSKLIELLDQNNASKLRCQAALALRNLASDSDLQLEIVRLNGLQGLKSLLTSGLTPLVLASVACIRNISINPLNEDPIIASDFLRPLIASVRQFPEVEEIQCHAISALRNLAASADRNKRKIMDAGAVEMCIELLPQSPSSVQSEMTAYIAVTALADDLKLPLLKFKLLNVFIPLLYSSSVEIRGNSAAAIGNLVLGMSSASDEFSAIVSSNWSEPMGGLAAYFETFLTSNEATFEHIAVWTILQMLESKNEGINTLIVTNPVIKRRIEEIAEGAAAFQNSGDDSDMACLALKCVEFF